MTLHAEPAVADKQSACEQIHSVHVIAGLDPIYGGPSYSVPRLCQALAAAGAQLTLLSVAAAREAPRDIREDGYRDWRFTQDYSNLLILRGLRSSSALSRALRETASRLDLVHNHGL